MNKEDTDKLIENFIKESEQQRDRLIGVIKAFDVFIGEAKSIQVEGGKKDEIKNKK